MAEARLPKWILLPLLRWYVAHYRVNLDEAEKPLEDYNSLLEFFTRRLKSGARVIDAEAVVVSPVDGTLSSLGRIDGEVLVPAKGHRYTLEELLGEPESAASFIGGSFAVIYLSPRDYHRIHSPVSGEIEGFIYSPGRLLPVNPPSVSLFPKLFAVNERVTTLFSLEGGKKLALIKVGALHVGKIALFYTNFKTNSSGKASPLKREFSPPLAIEKGEDLACFELGSTVIILLSPELSLLPLQVGETVLMGSPLVK